MALKSHFTYGTSHKKSPKSTKADPASYVRVVKVILNIDDPDCKDASMINGVIYRVPSLASDENTVEGKSLAYQGNTNIRVLPLPGELVKIDSKPSAGKGAKPGPNTKYWTDIVPIWGHPHHNAAPDTGQEEWKNSLLGGLADSATINPIQANPGDMLLEGRLGQSIRFGGYTGKASTIIDELSSGKPVVLISNGQIVTKNGTDLIQEDINKDYNSIYLVADNRVPLTQVNSKRDSYDLAPQTADQYRGNQVIVNGGRLFFNAKEESILLSAKESVGLNATTVNLDATDYICLDGKTIFLGAGARRATFIRQPVILGSQFENWMNTLLDTLQHVAAAMTNASAVSGGPVTQLNMVGPELTAVIRSLRTQMAGFKSKKVFTE
jgi:hypothetical protein